jgi:hypothetical protein
MLAERFRIIDTTISRRWACADEPVCLQEHNH